MTLSRYPVQVVPTLMELMMQCWGAGQRDFLQLCSLSLQGISISTDLQHFFPILRKGSLFQKERSFLSTVLLVRMIPFFLPDPNLKDIPRIFVFFFAGHPQKKGRCFISPQLFSIAARSSRLQHPSEVFPEKLNFV